MAIRQLFSFAILSYNNYKYLKEALISVFNQDYPNIQLIISNDGSTDFDEKDLIEFLNQNKPDTVKQIIINNNERNLGTVKNIQYCREQAEGEFIMFMAADDALYDNTVLSRFADEFIELGEDALCICAKVAMCTDSLSDITEYFPDEEGIEAIKTFSTQEMFSRLSHTFTIPTTGTCYRKSLYDKIGAYDEEYFIMEDAPLYIKMARMDIKFHWIDDFIAARHRDGGVSHGNTMNLSVAYQKYRYDEILCYKKEILPYKNLINSDDLIHMEQKWKYLDSSYFFTFLYPNMSSPEKVKYSVKNAPYLVKRILKKGKAKIIAYSFDQAMARELTNIGICLFIIYIMLDIGFLDVFLKDKVDILSAGLGWVLLFTLSMVVFLYGLRIIYKIYIALKHALQHKKFN